MTNDLALHLFCPNIGNFWLQKENFWMLSLHNQMDHITVPTIYGSTYSEAKTGHKTTTSRQPLLLQTQFFSTHCRFKASSNVHISNKYN